VGWLSLANHFEKTKVLFTMRYAVLIFLAALAKKSS